MIPIILQRTTSSAFKSSLILILVAEVITILVAWRLLDFGIKRWLDNRTAMAVRVSQVAAAEADWSQADKIPEDRETKLGDRYLDELDKLSNLHFPRNEGSVYLVVIDNGEEYDIRSGDYKAPVIDSGKANQWENAAYSTRKLSYSPMPIVDNSGTYLAAYTPILRSAKVIGLMAAEYDSASFADFRSIVNAAFWFSVLPAIFLSLTVAYVLASWFVEPMEVRRSIAEAAQSQRDLAVKGQEAAWWDRLTARQRQVADLWGQGKSYKQIAQALSISTHTVKQHLDDIRARTGLDGFQLALKAAVRISP